MEKEEFQWIGFVKTMKLLCYHISDATMIHIKDIERKSLQQNCIILGTDVYKCVFIVIFVHPLN